MARGMPGSAVTFYFDLGSPYAYLAAERIVGLVDRPIEFQPILLGGIFGMRGRGSWSQTPERAAGIAEVERRAADYDLPPVTWPEPWPGNMLAAMRAATVAAERGRARDFALAAFRAAFVEGRDLSQLVVIDDVAEGAGLNGVRIVQELSNPRIKQSLADATAAAWAAGVQGVPTMAVDGVTYYGDDQLSLLLHDLSED